ncbi:MAG TPA: transglutaminaseTgpA domain-containing protein [Kofleriaceae bacterium]|jgi:transglutaminase-like putative cysteine protease|nr:transglutaminaseTgpA domain-containing protein [Kofleriaceae bacterium]
MRFAQAHKTTSYLTVAAAMVALMSGGGVSPAVALLGLAGLTGSWWWEAPRVAVDRWTWLFTTLSVIALAWGVVAAVASGDYLGEGAGFLVLLTVARAYTRKAAKDWQQLYLLAFLMLVAGSVLSGDLIYGACFLLFVISSTWTLILFHLRREMEDNFLLKHADPRASERVEVRRILESRRIVDRRFFVGTGLVSVGVFVLAALMFLTIPRVGMGFFFRGRGGMNMVGFSDGVKLGGHGRIKGDDTIVMRVEVSDPRLRGRAAPYLYWRGVAFDLYKNGEWTRSRRAPSSRLQVEYLGPTRQRRYPITRGATLTSDAMAARRDGAVKQEIWLDPLGSDVLFGASTPVAFELDVPPRSRPNLERNDEVRVRHDGPIHYTVWSEVTLPGAVDADALRAATGELPRGFDVYLQVPPEVTARTRALAAELTAGATNDYDKVVRLRDWLVEHLSYTLDLRDPGGQEPIDFFLFDRKQGHCEYFASAFAILARSVGVPTRSVNGFLGGEWNEYDGYIAVRAGDAHSWTEVYFPGHGWVTFDATPPGQHDRLGRGGSGWRARLGRWIDTLRFQWNKWVIDYDLYQQLSLFRSVGKQFSGGARSLAGAWRAVKRWAAEHGPWLAAAAAAVAAALVTWLRRRRRRVDGDRPARPRARQRSEIATLYERAARRVARRGHRRDPATTPRELARDLASRSVPGAAELAELTELYYVAAWGGTATDEMRARARVLAAAIDAATAGPPAAPPKPLPP